jgi:hypothetical protein
MLRSKINAEPRFRYAVAVVASAFPPITVRALPVLGPMLSENVAFIASRYSMRRLQILGTGSSAARSFTGPPVSLPNLVLRCRTCPCSLLRLRLGWLLLGLLAFCWRLSGLRVLLWLVTLLLGSLLVLRSRRFLSPLLWLRLLLGSRLRLRLGSLPRLRACGMILWRPLLWRSLFRRALLRLLLPALVILVLLASLIAILVLSGYDAACEYS